MEVTEGVPTQGYRGGKDTRDPWLLPHSFIELTPVPASPNCYYLTNSNGQAEDVLHTLKHAHVENLGVIIDEGNLRLYVNDPAVTLPKLARLGFFVAMP